MDPDLGPDADPDQNNWDGKQTTEEFFAVTSPIDGRRKLLVFTCMLRVFECFYSTV